MSLPNTCKVTVANNETDFQQLVDLALRYHASAPEFFSPLSLRKMITRLALALAKHPCFCLKTEKGEIVGAIILDDISPWWGDYSYLTDLFIFIDKDYRSFPNFSRLIRGVTNYAKTKKIRLEMTLFNPDDLDRKEVLMEKLGFKTVAVQMEYKGD